jgi:hypothetical protein
LWFELTDKTDDTEAPETLANNQHHQGTDWIYGGWDRDVMQADVAQNGPNAGDRLIDWNGAFNLYTHCNAAYGGFNDVRIPSPAMLAFVQQWATGLGAGRPGPGTPDVLTPGTSAYGERRDHGWDVGVPGARVRLQPGLQHPCGGSGLSGYPGSLRRSGVLLGLSDRARAVL